MAESETKVSVCFVCTNVLTIIILFFPSGIRSQSKPQDIMHEVFRAMKTLDFVRILVSLNEPVCEKTNNLGSDQVRHKPVCTVSEYG